MKYQVFTRTPGNRPRRAAVMLTLEGAREFCTARNKERSARQVRDGFHYEFTTVEYYNAAWG